MIARIKITKLILTGWLVLFSQISSAEYYPPYLSYYPKCDYQVIDTVEIDKIVSHKNKLPEASREILDAIQLKAKKKSADAIILVDKKIKSELMRQGELTRIPVFRVRYKAQFINECADLTEDKNRPIAINELGNKIAHQWSVSLQSPSFTLKPKAPKKLYHPSIEKTSVSIDKGIYGIALGSSEQQVVELFGDPSVEIAHSEIEKVLGYGRRHWFYFKQDSLVYFTTQSLIYDADFLNNIPQREFFDDFSWIIEGKLKYGASIEQSKLGLASFSSKLIGREIIINKKDKKMILHFNTRKDLQTDETISHLAGVTLKLEDYKLSPSKHSDSSGVFKTLSKIILQAESKQEMEEQLHLLGTPRGRLRLKSNEDIYVYNEHLAIKMKRSHLSKIYFKHNVYLNSYLTDYKPTPWHFANYQLGQSIEEIKSSLPDTAYVSEDSINLDFDDWQLELFFEKLKQKTQVVDAEVIIY